ncbi:HAMP domain-containing histidine kinase [Halarcobacter anaerophilus]|uniref:HAMP domain-containing histidine kinase n=1 Tax=Halarcobacter anaerophilus TaxID=877500 RepID=UPI000695A90A|nr:HAMP domain-containing histidine kinase [Halarcobacter anaerophilus]
MLEKKLTDEKAVKRLNRIKLASNELLKLYEDMEYHIKKEIDRVDITNFSLVEVIEHSLEKFEDLKKDTKIEVFVEDVTLNSDQNGFQKMIDNLISNALKYNNEKEGLIKIEYKNKNLTIFNRGKEIDTKNLFVILISFFKKIIQKRVLV